MLKHPELTKGRLARFSSELSTYLYPKHVPLQGLEAYSAPDRISYDEAVKGKYRVARLGETFRPDWSTHWFRIKYAVPADWRGQEVLLHFDSTSEGCIWQDGVPLQGLTNYLVLPQDVRSYFTLTKKAKGAEKGQLYVEVAVNGMFGLGDRASKFDELHLGYLRHARLVVRDREVWDLLWDFVVIKEMADHLPVTGPHQGHALTTANAMVNAVTLGDNATFPAARRLAKDFFALHNGTRNHHVTAIGHAHIDTAWLWPLAETMRKCYRTFSTAVRMMDDYPEYKFACSQAQQLAWIKEQHPILYRKLQAKARKGQFVIVGGTWIEPDCNIPSGESLVRQFLLGQRFFKKEFGSFCREFWNPDVFGYSGALPQIMKGAGIEFFLTQKLSWNQFNRPTSSTFLWEGIDGSRVLTHFPPTDTYNGICTVEEILKHYTGFKDKERATESMMLFGYGDGGGGPTEEMLERIRRMDDVLGLPEVKIRSSQEFFKRCQDDLKDPLVWSGELYFELHRGTYTTQAANKRDNRRCEEALHDLEFLSALAWQAGKAAYSHEKINQLWETVLLNQFHDIIPGSSINEVYVDSARDYARVLEGARELQADLVKKLFEPQNPGQARTLLSINTLSWPRREVTKLPSGKGFSFVQAPGYGYAVATAESTTQAPVTVSLSKTGFTLENGLVCARFDQTGRLSSFYDKRHARETVATGCLGNQLVLFDDLPEKWEAWDVDVFHLEKRSDVGEPAAIRVVESHPLKATVEIAFKMGPKSSLIQRISLMAESPRLDFSTDVDWREKHKFLKVEFPLALRSDHATYEIQFGHVRRPTHFNTTWDVARFEVSAHRWADLSETNYGVALLNDSKYGYACHGNVLRLSLLRSSKAPDEMADMGRHHFRYALFPHAQGPQLGGVIAEAAAFNQPLQISPSLLEPRSVSFFRIDNPAVVLDTVKKAEDSDDFILRFYESQGAHQTATLTSSLKLHRAVAVNLLEEKQEVVPIEDNVIRMKVRPFEIVSLLVSFPSAPNRGKSI